MDFNTQSIHLIKFLPLSVIMEQTLSLMLYISKTSIRFFLILSNERPSVIRRKAKTVTFLSRFESNQDPVMPRYDLKRRHEKLIESNIIRLQIYYE